MVTHGQLFTLLRYLSVSVSVYAFILLGMYVLVDWLQFGELVGYVIVYLCAYSIDYLMTLKFVFRSDHHWLKVVKYVIHTLVFLLIGSFVFKAFLHFGVHYLIATFAAALVMFPVRYYSNKYLVYR